MLAYFCELCTMLFWIPADVVQDHNPAYLNEEFNGRRISCPCCTGAYNVKRDEKNDLEEDA